ncbi:MAG: 50S ribosomal protein L28 [Bradymonadales bacterium]|nr:MAG: 50S ribosomal protein L28 [Bradymonadales bacterium]
MSRVCELTGKRGLVGNTVSNANNKRRTKSFVNLTEKSYLVPEAKRKLRVRLSNRAIRTVDKLGGLLPACRKYEESLSPRLSKLLRSVKNG